MASRSTTVEKEGYMWVKRQPSVKQLKAWKLRYVALKKCSGYESRARLEWYESHDAFLVHQNPKSLSFDAIKFVGNFHSQSKEYAFIVIISDQKQLQMAAKTEGEKAEWIKTLKQFLHKQSASCVSCDSTSCDHLTETFTEGAYSVSPTADTPTSYLVKFKESTVNSELLNLKGDYLLNVRPKYVTLSTSGPKEQQNCVLSWSLDTIKSYNSRPTESNPTMKLLTIETGRRSSTGRGVFQFMTPFGQQIADQIRLNTKRTYFEKMKSQESIVQDFAYGSSPDTSSSRFPTSSPKFVGAHMSPKLSIKSLDHPVIPFHEYDDHSEASQGSFASYIQHENGYIHVLTAQEDVEKFKERKGSRPSVEHEPNSAGDDHSTYIEVLGEDEQHDQSRDDTSPNERSRGLSSHENDYPTYIEVIEEAQDPTYIEVIEEAQGQEGCFGDNRDRHQVRREIYEKNESVTQFVMDECVYSNSKRWESLTSQTSSQEGSSVSSENEVFRKELSTPSDVFPELPAKIPNNLQQISENDNSVEESVVESSQAETKLPLEVQRRLQRESQDSDNGEVINSENFSRKENSNTNSWHSGNGSDLADTSETHDTTSSGSESESEVGNSQDSQEICEEEVVGDTDHRHRTNSDTTNLESPSPRDSFDGSLKPTEMRPRSFTTSDVSVLASNETYNPKLLQDLLERMTYPQHFFPANNHPVLKRESPATCSKPGVQLEDEIAAQLMHPTAAASWGTSERARTRHSAGEIKYVCSECGWYKRSRKRSVLKKAKKCERCKKLIYKSSTTDSTRQKSPKSPKKDKGNSIFNRVTRKLRESQQGSVDSFEFDRPDRPTTSVHPKPSFVKQLNNRVPIHNPALNSKLGALGIAPSQARMIKALTIGGDSQTPLRSKPPVQNENTSSTVKNPLTPSFSEGSVSASPVSPPEPERRSPAQATVPKMTSTSPGENENLRVPVTRAASSPVGNMETETTSDLLTEFRNDKASPRKLSGGNLPPLPEVDVVVGETVHPSPGPSTQDAPPAIPPRTREEPPPVPPRRASGPLIRKGEYTKLKRAQTDPTNTLTVKSLQVPKVQEKQRISRTMTDPGNNRVVKSDNIRNAVSMGNLVEENQESTGCAESTLVKTSHSLGDGLDDTPPPLPPRKLSVTAQAPPPPLSPRRASNGVGKSSNCDPLRTESRGRSESKRLSPEHSPQKPPLRAKRSLEARRNFQTRNPMYAEHVTEQEVIFPS